MKEQAKKTALTVLIALLTATAFVATGYVLYLTLPHFLVFLIAYLTAVAIEPLNKLFMRIKWVKRLPSVTVTFVVFMTVMTLLLYLTFTKLLKEFIALSKFVQRSLPEIQQWFIDIYNNIHTYILMLPQEIAHQMNIRFDEFAQSLIDIDIVTPISHFAVALSKSLPNFFFMMIIYFVAVFFFSLYLPKIHEGILDIFKPRKREVITVLATDIKNATVGFLEGQLILSTLTFLIAFAGLKLLGINYAAAIALLITIVDILPFVGTGVTLVPWAIFEIATDDYLIGIGIFVLWLVILIVRKAIEPYVLGNRIGIGPIATLISIWVGFKAFGAVGILLGPLAVIIFLALVRIGIINRNLRI